MAIVSTTKPDAHDIAKRLVSDSLVCKEAETPKKGAMQAKDRLFAQGCCCR
jgi:cobalamin-dependent methionine synthase I